MRSSRSASNAQFRVVDRTGCGYITCRVAQKSNTHPARFSRSSSNARVSLMPDSSASASAARARCVKLYENSSRADPSAKESRYAWENANTQTNNEGKSSKTKLRVVSISPQNAGTHNPHNSEQPGARPTTGRVPKIGIKGTWWSLGVALSQQPEGRLQLEKHETHLGSAAVSLTSGCKKLKKQRKKTLPARTQHYYLGSKVPRVYKKKETG